MKSENRRRADLELTVKTVNSQRQDGLERANWGAQPGVSGLCGVAPVFCQRAYLTNGLFCAGLILALSFAWPQADRSCDSPSGCQRSASVVSMEVCQAYKETWAAVSDSGTAQVVEQTRLIVDGTASMRSAAYAFEKHSGIVYRIVDDKELECDVYVPLGEETFPAVLLVHGGAWRSGSKFQVSYHARVLARAGYVVVAINYRHAPEHKFPAQIEDCKAAVAWMRKNAAEYKIDPDRIGAWGYSAGGHLVSLLGTTGSDRAFERDLPDELKAFSTHVSAVVAGGAPCDFSWLEEESELLSYWLGDSARRNPRVYRLATPATHVNADCPPFYLFHGSGDAMVPIESSRKLYDHLIAKGIAATYAEYPKMGHLETFVNMQALRASIQFLDEHLKPTETSDNH
ncbi:MAG TPA: alpha/beta hydrolase [Pirellulaceae bacterium]|nr:alpha/beta hydrolase [Pirellulaceae bacterium]HMO93497.1 alpha/beta hydrolase [Pirellulaceae bacterium]HMP70402.1 alpha/beta hydrolase [Pirellulaceae bacterium]